MSLGTTSGAVVSGQTERRRPPRGQAEAALSPPDHPAAATTRQPADQRCCSRSLLALLSDLVALTRPADGKTDLTFSGSRRRRARARFFRLRRQRLISAAGLAGTRDRSRGAPGAEPDNSPARLLASMHWTPRNRRRTLLLDRQPVTGPGNRRLRILDRAAGNKTGAGIEPAERAATCSLVSAGSVAELLPPPTA